MSPLQISPAYPPYISGVGDYAALLAEEFRRVGWSLATLVAGHGGVSGALPGKATVLERADAAALADALGGANRVLLHFSGYGYATRGLCRWLVDGLGRWKEGGKDRRLVTMFHEVYATGQIWRSSFWTAGAQRRIARDLARLSDAGFASSQGGRTQLARLAPELSVEVIPVFSNMGEPTVPKPLFDRIGRAVVFGGRARRRRVYEGLEAAGGALAQRFIDLGVKDIVDIGPALDLPGEIAGCTVQLQGALPATEVSTVLSEARIGLIDYPGHVFTKSGIAAAYFAHGVPVVNTSSVGGFPGDLQEGLHFLSVETFSRGAFNAEEIAKAGHDWYQPHGIAATADKYRASLE